MTQGFLPDAVTPKKSKEISDDGIYETLNLSANTSPFNYQHNNNQVKTVLSQNDLDSKIVLGQIPEIPDAKGRVLTQEMNPTGNRRMIQPLFNKTFAVSQSDSKEKTNTLVKMQSQENRRISSFLERNVPKTNSQKHKSAVVEESTVAEEKGVFERLSNLVKTGMDFQEEEEKKPQKERDTSVPRKQERRILSPPKVAQTKINNNMKVEQLIRGKKTFNHSVNMSEYLKRRGLKENTKVFCFNSRDEHIKRALKKFGWVENQNPASFLYDFKWTYTDVEADYANMMEGQYFNHFPNNKELTMKSGLIENVRANNEHGNDFWDFFPRAYDLGHPNQMSEFQEDYERTALVNLIKKHWQYIKAKADPKMVQKAKEKFTLKQEKKAQVRLIDIFKKKKIMKVRNYQEEEMRKDFVVHLFLLETAVNCARTFVHQHQNIAEADTFFALSQLNAKTKTALLAYSQYSLPYEEISSSQKKPLLNGEEQWQTPNELMIYKVYKMKELIKRFLPQYHIDGTENIWIIKPSGNARGSGIFLTDSLEEALDSGAKNQARIIQKYIERPLIIKDSIYANLNNKKFDIRQWVLVSSMNPLVIYIFSSSYIRLCSQRFELKDIKNNFKHLTNFSLNKTNYTNSVEDSVCHIDLLKQHLKATQGIEWDVQIKPKIEEIIIKTISSAADSIEQRVGCFDMYGFDLLLDDKCQPWLLEVNLSPACTERTPWLTDMLDQMAEGLLKCILPSDYLQAGAAENQEKSTVESEEKSTEGQVELKEKQVYNWELIYKAEMMRDLAINNNIVLEIAGTKANIKKEQEIDKKYFQQLAAIRIQKTYKMYRCKKEKLLLKQSKVIVVIQKHVRRLLAQAKLRKLREIKATQIIKDVVRIQGMKKRLQRFKENEAAVKIQKAYKGFMARRLYKHMKYVKKVVKIQSHWRKALAVKKKKELRKRLVMTVRIQRYWKKRFRDLKKKATRIEAYWRMKRARRAFLKYKKEKKAAIKIQSCVRMFVAKRKKQSLLIERAEMRFKEKRIKRFGEILFERMKLSQKYSTFFEKLNAVVLKVSFKAIKSRADLRNKMAVRIQGLLKIKKAKIRRRRLYRRKMVVRLQTYWRMYSKKKKYILRKKIVKAIWVIQRVARMFLAKLELRRLRREKELEAYNELQMRKMEQEMLLQQQLEKQRRREEAEKRKQLYFKQKDHIAQMSAARPKVQPKGANNKNSTEGFNAEKKKVEVIKNTEILLKSIYNIERPLAKPGTSVAKKRDGMASRTLTGGGKKRGETAGGQNIDFGMFGFGGQGGQSGQGGNDNGMNALFKLFSKSPNFN